MATTEDVNVLEEKVFKETIELHTAFTIREIASDIGLDEDLYVDKGKPELLVNLEGAVQALESDEEKKEWLERAIQISLDKEVQETTSWSDGSTISNESIEGEGTGFVCLENTKRW